MRQDEIEDVLAFHAHEMAVDTPADRRWEKWCRDTALALGVPHLDGDGARDGYSLDAAFDFFKDGLSPKDAAEEFRAAIAAMSGAGPAE